MSNKKQSSVEWFAKESWNLELKMQNKEITFGEYSVVYALLIEQAKAMHKQETIHTYSKGMEDGYYFKGSRYDYEAEGTTEYFGEQYYNETFGGKDA